MSGELYILRLKIENLENRARNSVDDTELEFNCEKLLDLRSKFESLAREELGEQYEEIMATSYTTDFKTK